MKRFVLVFVSLLLIFPGVLAGCGPKSAETVAKKKVAKSPFSFDYQTDSKDAAFFAKGDTFNTLHASSPLYGGTKAYPNAQLAEFEVARKKKAGQVEKSAQSLVESSRKLRKETEKLRQAFLDFLTAAYKADKGFKPMVEESFAGISTRHTKAEVLDIEYTALAKGNSKNAFADSFAGYLGIHKAVEFSTAALRDVEEISGAAALGLELAGKSKKPAVKKAAKKMDRQMSEFDDLLPDIKQVVVKQERLDYGLRQLQTADYYLAKEANDFMASNMSSVKAAADKIKPRGPIDKQDAKFMKDYVKLVDGFRKQLAGELKKIDKKNLVAVESAPGRGWLPWAWAAEPGENYGRALQVLSEPPKAPEPGWLSKGWSAIKTTVRGAKTAVGVTLDTAGVAVRNVSRIGFGVYNGESPSTIWQDMQENTRVIRDNYNRGISGASTFNTAGEYLGAVETGAGSAVESGVEETIGKGWTSWALGGITKTTVGMFTGLGKGIFKVSKTDATNVELVEGTLDVGLSLIGGSKVIIKGSQVPGLFRGLGSEAMLAGQEGLNFLRSLANNRSKKAIIAEMAELLGKKALSSGEVTALIRNSAELEARQALTATLREARKNVLAEMGRILKEGGRTALTESLQGIKGQLDDLFRASFERNLGGIRQALNTAGGATARDYLDNLIGSWADDLIKGAVKDIMTSAPQPSEMNGNWAGTMKITAVNPALLDDDKSNDPEGCDFTIDFSELKGKTSPIEWNLSLDDSGHGTLTLADDGGSGPASYADGKLTAGPAKEGGTLNLSGTFTRDDNGYISGAGGGRLVAKGGWFAKISWSVTPK